MGLEPDRIVNQAAWLARSGSRGREKVVSEYINANRAGWDELAPQHAGSRFYDVDGFRAGRLSLRPVERNEVGPVSGKSLLHLQCHFGLDTLSWARLGGRVTGVDFSAEAIKIARALAEELGLSAEFVCTDVYELPDVLGGQFDVVFASYGVLPWLPDLTRWAGVIAHFVRPGGIFYLVEHHPLLGMLDEEANAPELRVRYPYFHSGEPLRSEPDASYAGGEARRSGVFYEWTHSLGDVVNALVQAGLTIRFVHEFPVCGFRALPFMQQSDDGWWRLPDGLPQIPLLFSLKAWSPR